jgi:pyruvate,water dikinase
MVIDISSGNISGGVGNKAKSLMVLKKQGFNVPGGFILDKHEFFNIIAFNGKEEAYRDILKSTQDTKALSRKLSQLVEGLIIPEGLLNQIENNLKPGVKYAVRSSGIKEDLGNLSFAGQYSTTLNALGLNEISKAIINCYKSMYSENITSYFINNKISLDSIEMAVIVQEMIDSEKSGIIFTVNPITGNDKEIIIEISEGLGENIVSGKVVPERHTYNWFKKTKLIGSNLLPKSELKSLISSALKIQGHFGFPCDIEFAFSGGNLYILQSRAITKIMYSMTGGQWTTADFKDGGVSATVCHPFMWGLYEYIWESSLKNFLVESKLLKEPEIPKLGRMFFGRPYWNLSAVKKAMAKVPGYKERGFDNDLGIKITYEGDGETTGFTPKSLFGIARIALAQKKILAEWGQNAEAYKTSLLEKYNQYLISYQKEYSLAEMEAIWYKLTKKSYLYSESTYFRQIFINTVHQSIIKSSLLKHVSPSGYLNLLGGLENISHLLPFNDMWEIGGKIFNDKEAFDYWSNHGVIEIKDDYNDGQAGNYFNEVKSFINKYAYHSDKELDVSYPCYYEDTIGVIKKFKEIVLLRQTGRSINTNEKQTKAYKAELEQIKRKTTAGQYNKILKTIEKMRGMLWWREEFRDISTRFYFLIRLYTIKLAEFYVEENILDEVDDIWHLKVADLWAYIDKIIDKPQIRYLARRNKCYYNSFRNFNSENEIGSIFAKEATGEKRSGQLAGIGCNNGVVKGRAKVIESLEEIDNLMPGDILVTKFTDTGWTGKFSILKGIVTESGGILCHAAIVSREYGIPCIVGVNNATKIIKTGSIIEINGTTGGISVISGS